MQSAYGAISNQSTVAIFGKVGAQWFVINQAATTAGFGAAFISEAPNTGSNWYTSTVVNIDTSNNISVTFASSGYINPANGALATGAINWVLTPVGVNLPTGSLYAGVPYTGVTIPTIQPFSTAVPFGGVGHGYLTPGVTTIYFMPLSVPTTDTSNGAVTGPVMLGAAGGVCTTVTQAQALTTLTNFMSNGTTPCSTPDSCIFTQYVDCSQNVAPNYCTTGDTCGACFGVCPDSSKPCLNVAGSTPGTGSFSCTPQDELVTFWAKYKIYIIVAVVAVLLLIFGIIIFMVMRKSGPTPVEAGWRPTTY